MALNPSQEAAVRNSGVQLVLAGPGSGKTRVITEKVLHLLREGVPASAILALTFSDKAALEMIERLKEEKAPVADLTVSTFHSFCLSVLEENVIDSGISFASGVISRANQLVWGLKNIDAFGFEYIQVGNNGVDAIESIIEGISAFRDELIPSDELAAYCAAKRASALPPAEEEYVRKLSDLAKVYQAYEQYKRAEKLIDFD
ncbi:MAG: ATP-dependent helicase, partial [Methanobacteriota archaeon]